MGLTYSGNKQRKPQTQCEVPWSHNVSLLSSCGGTPPSLLIMALPIRQK